MKLVTSAILSEGNQQFAEMTYRSSDDEGGELIMLRVKIEPEGGYMRIVECHLTCILRGLKILGDELTRLQSLRERRP